MNQEDVYGDEERPERTIIFPGEEPKQEVYDFSKGKLAEQIKELKEKIGMDKAELTPEAEQARAEAPEESGIPGKEINWEDYDLDPKYAHFYPKSTFMETGAGPKFVVEITEFHSENKNPTGSIGTLNQKGQPVNLGEYMTYLVNGQEQWHPFAFIPGGTGSVYAIFQRRVKVALPDPVLIEKETKVEKPTDEELKKIEDKALAWTGESSSNPEHEEQNSGASTEISGEVGNVSE